ncbi:MAG: polyisoprenyl-teichoic acid--peptidoglycan teichoic acid transferase [Chloroflexota bacterium]|jgi:LCP family protein required for cell wall assembly|nr:polyisoprenyl-teichoic acid--peptidoglycan teichoic acid transferase [Chloroflexota bacterium]
MARARTAVALILVAVLVVLVIGAAAVWTGVHNIAPRMSLSDVVDLFHPGVASSVRLKIQHNQRINVLLMARGGAGSDNPYFTDSMLVFSIQPRSRRAVLVSLPRFLLVQIPALTTGNVTGKLYTAFDMGAKQDNPGLRSVWKTATGAGDLAAASVSEVTGLPIDGWIAVDVGGFRAIVDALGGIEVTVPTPLNDPQYPADDSSRRVPIHFDAGTQRMSGDRALEYARSRLSTSEADRSARQELVLVAILQRLRSLKAGPQLLSLLGALQGRVLTNLRPADSQALADLQKTLPPDAIHRMTVDTTNFVDDETVAGGSEVALPRDRSFATLTHYLALALPDPRLVDAGVEVIISDGSRAYQLPGGQTPAQIEVQVLADLGWNAVLGPDRRATPIAHTEIAVGLTDSALSTGQWMAEYFGGSTVTAAPATPSTVRVILGTDYTTRTFPASSATAG